MSYPRCSWEELGGVFLGLMAYLDLKGEGEKSYRKPAAESRRRGGVLRGPVWHGEIWIACCEHERGRRVCVSWRARHFLLGQQVLHLRGMTRAAPPTRLRRRSAGCCRLPLGTLFSGQVKAPCTTFPLTRTTAGRRAASLAGSSSMNGSWERTSRSASFPTAIAPTLFPSPSANAPFAV